MKGASEDTEFLFKAQPREIRPAGCSLCLSPVLRRVRGFRRGGGLAGLTVVLLSVTNCYESRTQLVVELFETSRGFGLPTEALSILRRRKSFKKVYLR